MGQGDEVVKTARVANSDRKERDEGKIRYDEAVTQSCCMHTDKAVEVQNVKICVPLQMWMEQLAPTVMKST